VLCVVGHHTACAEVKGFRFSGLLAWLMWRGIYLSKLPSLERKVRVLVDWIIELFFPRDIVQTIDFSERAKTLTGSPQETLGSAQLLSAARPNSGKTATAGILRPKASE